MVCGHHPLHSMFPCCGSTREYAFSLWKHEEALQVWLYEQVCSMAARQSGLAPFARLGRSCNYALSCMMVAQRRRTFCVSTAGQQVLLSCIFVYNGHTCGGAMRRVLWHVGWTPLHFTDPRACMDTPRVKGVWCQSCYT